METMAKNFALAVNGVTDALGQAWNAAAPVVTGRWIFDSMHDYEDVNGPRMRDPHVYEWFGPESILPSSDTDIVDDTDTKIYNHQLRNTFGMVSLAPLGAMGITAAMGALGNVFGGGFDMGSIAMYTAMAAAVPPIALHAHAATSAATYGLKKFYQAGMNALDAENDGDTPSGHPPQRSLNSPLGM